MFNTVMHVVFLAKLKAHDIRFTTPTMYRHILHLEVVKLWE